MSSLTEAQYAGTEWLFICEVDFIQTNKVSNTKHKNHKDHVIIQHQTLSILLIDFLAIVPLFTAVVTVTIVGCVILSRN